MKEGLADSYVTEVFRHFINTLIILTCDDVVEVKNISVWQHTDICSITKTEKNKRTKIYYHINPLLDKESYL